MSFRGINRLGHEEVEAVLDVLRKGPLFRCYGPEPPTHVAQLEDWGQGRRMGELELPAPG